MTDSYQPKIVDKPWGREVWYAHTDRYAGKILEVDAGHLLSLQKHVVKHETLYLLSGLMEFTRDGDVFEWTPGTAMEIPPETVHRMEAIEDSVILEVSTPELDDVVRLDDRYGRTDDAVEGGYAGEDGYAGDAEDAEDEPGGAPTPDASGGASA